MITNNETNTNSERDAMLAGLRAFVRQRPGFDFRNYWSGDHWNALSDARANYRADLRPIMQAKRDAEMLLRYIEGTQVTAEQLKEAAKHAFSGRLSWDGKEWDYCTGQYWPTEYRKAACVVLATCLSNYWRTPGTTWETLQKQARNVFGRGAANRLWRCFA